MCFIELERSKFFYSPNLEFVTKRFIRIEIHSWKLYQLTPPKRQCQNSGISNIYLQALRFRAAGLINLGE